MDATTVGRRLRWARRRAGLTQQQLADKVGMPQPNIARIEVGSVLPRTATLIGLLEATGHRIAVEPMDPVVDRATVRRRLAMEIPQRTRAAHGLAAVKILRRLRRFGVPFVLIGELAEVAHGSPGTVRSPIEVCHASTDVARARLAQALEDLGPDADADHLRLLAETAAGDDYDTLARNAVGMHVDAGILVPVAALEDLIRDRRARGTPADVEAAAVLGALEVLRVPG